MDADDPHCTVTDQPLFPLPNNPSTQSGMGLPFELWDHIIAFLELEPYPLLACCLACRAFSEHAGSRLEKLYSPQLSLDNYIDIDRLVDEIRTIPGRARAIREFTLTGEPALTFSLIPHRLASQLVNLRILQLIHISALPNVPLSTWSLYGRALPNVTSLSLAGIQFPSFMDFIHFVASFPALNRLYLVAIVYTRTATPPRALRSPCKLKPLEDLVLWDVHKDEGHFLRSFLPWFSSRGNTIQRLGIDIAVTSHPLGVVLLQKIHAHLQVISLRFSDQLLTEASQTYWRKSLGE